MRRISVLIVLPLFLLSCAREWKNPYAQNNTGGSETLPTDGLVAWYPLSGSANDESGNKNHAVLNGPLPAPDRLGRSGRACIFDGADDHIILPNSLIISCMPITVTVWIKTAKSGAVLGYENTAYPGQPGNYVPMIYVGGDGRLRALVWPGANRNAMGPMTSLTALTDDQWHFIVLSATSAHQYLYCDGKLMADIAGTVDYLTMIYCQIGAAYATNWPSALSRWMMFTGSIDDLRIYSRILTSDEMQALYREGGFVPPLDTPALSAWGVADDSVKTRWSTAPLANQYELEGAAAKTGPFSALYSGSDTSYVHTGLSKSQRVWYRVRAKNGSRSSAWSDTVAAVALSFAGWTRNPINGHYYFLLTPAKDWVQSKELAELLGTRLVTIRSQVENDWLIQNFRVSDSDVNFVAWTGFTDEFQEGVWQWVSKEAVTFTRWYTGEPNNSKGGENSGSIYLSNRDGVLGYWNDLAYNNITGVRGALLERPGR